MKFQLVCEVVKAVVEVTNSGTAKPLLWTCILTTTLPNIMKKHTSLLRGEPKAPQPSIWYIFLYLFSLFLYKTSASWAGGPKRNDVVGLVSVWLVMLLGLNAHPTRSPFVVHSYQLLL